MDLIAEQILALTASINTALKQKPAAQEDAVEVKSSFAMKGVESVGASGLGMFESTDDFLLNCQSDMQL